MKIVLHIIIVLLIYFIFALPVNAQKQPASTSSQSFTKAKVIRVTKQGSKIVDGVKNTFQFITVKILDGADKGKNVDIKSGTETTLSPAQIVKKGDEIILTKLKTGQNSSKYLVYDSYRINSIIFIFLGFLVLVIFIAGKKGFGSIVGLGISLAIIFMYVVPRILAGADPLLVSIYGSIAILLLTTYLAHGISWQTTIALFSTFIALMLTSVISNLFVNLSHLTGFTEETSSLQFGVTSIINVKGLLLGGIIIGTLGALNDITTTQAASVFELSKLDATLPFKDLFNRSFAIGREHVVSMVNTLVLAYAGSSLALFLFLILNPQKLPFWVLLNSEDVSDEIVRTLAGSMGLVLVVPIVTLFAVLFCNKEVKRAAKEIFKSLR